MMRKMTWKSDFSAEDGEGAADNEDDYDNYEEY
jgi:hypothetical protein